MRKKIQELANARFHQERPTLFFSTEKVELKVAENENVQGEFIITSADGIEMEGVVSATTARMHCLTSVFQGTEVKISYEFHSEGLEEGKVEKGEFIIASNGGEYTLSYVITIVKLYPESSLGKIKNLFDFANLAQKSYEEALHIFQMPIFENLIKSTEQRETLLYRMVGRNKIGLDEFLIGIRKKKKVIFSLETDKTSFENPKEDITGKVRIRKEQWGYLELSITSDTNLLVPAKDKVTMADFQGDYAEIEYRIHRSNLRWGMNQAVLTFLGLNQTETVDFQILMGKSQNTVAQVSVKEPLHKEYAEKKRLYWYLMRLYLDYQMKKISIQEWADQSCNCLGRLKEMEPQNQWYLLYYAQVLLMNKQRQEAEWLLDDFRKEVPLEDTPLYAYYLYICTLQGKDSRYTENMFQKMDKIYKKYPKDFRMFRIILFTNPEWKENPRKKLSAIEKWISQGNNSPILYMEAFYLIRKDVYLLEKSDFVFMQILNWAAKEQVLTAEIADRVSKNIHSLQQYHPIWYKILKECYRAKPDIAMLQALCSFCIKWNIYTRESFQWFDKGVKEEFRIAGLYEAWMDGAGREGIEKFPKGVMLYFQNRKDLNDKKQALLYACIVKHKSNSKSLYSSYRQNIHEFAFEHLKKGEIDENLAVLYEDALEGRNFQKDISEALAKVAYTHWLVCRDSSVKKVVIMHHELKTEQVVSLKNHEAYVQLYTNNYYIMAENEHGTRYIPSETIHITKLMDSQMFLEEAIRYAPEELSFLVHYFDGKKLSHNYKEKDMLLLETIMEHPQVSDIFKQELKPQMVEYYYNYYRGTDLDQYLNTVDESGLDINTRKRLLELMISRGIYRRVYEILQKYGLEQLPAHKLLLVASQRILDFGKKEDAFTLELCKKVVRHGKYNQPVIEYLCQYFQGSLREMEQVWLYAKELEVYSLELEERYLTQLLYTEGYSINMDRIFKGFMDNNGDSLIVMAYLSYFSYCYFVKEAVTKDLFFQCLQKQVLQNPDLNDSCRLAYFQWLATKQDILPMQEKILEKLLQDYLKRKMYFKFYHQLPDWILRKYQLYDRTYQEYRSEPGRQVMIYYCDNENTNGNVHYREELMDHMYEGIYVKSFVVFFEQNIPYYIMEKGKKGMVIPESGFIRTNDLLVQGEESRYSMINDMMVSYQLQDEKTLYQLYLQYQEKVKLAEEKFRLL